MIEIFENNGLVIDDIFLRDNNYFPITYAEVDLETGYFEKVLTHREDIGICQCLDYFFQIELDKEKTENNENNSYYYITDNDYSSIANGIVSIDSDNLVRKHNKKNSKNNITVFNENGNKVIISSNNNDTIIDFDCKDKDLNIETTRNKSTFNMQLDVESVKNNLHKNVTKKSTISDDSAIFIIPNSIKVQRHLVSELGFDSKSRVYTQLSDHYGVSMLIGVRKININKITSLEVKEIDYTDINKNNNENNNIDYDNLL